MPTRRDYAAIAEQAIVSNRPLLALEFHPAAVAALDAFIDLTWGDEGAAPDGDRWQPGSGKGAAIVSLGSRCGSSCAGSSEGSGRRTRASPTTSSRPGSS